MTTDELFTQLRAIGGRFAGLSIDFRRGKLSTGWLGAWRIEILANKNERAGYRIVAFAETFEQAASEVVSRVRRLDTRP